MHFTIDIDITPADLLNLRDLVEEPAPAPDSSLTPNHLLTARQDGYKEGRKAGYTKGFQAAADLAERFLASEIARRMKAGGKPVATPEPTPPREPPAVKTTDPLGTRYCNISGQPAPRITETEAGSKAPCLCDTCLPMHLVEPGVF